MNAFKFLPTLILSLVTLGCNGEVDFSSSSPPDETTAECVAEGLPGQPMRRISSEQFDNIVRDLFGEELAGELAPLSTFPRTQISSGFSTFVTANPVNFAASSAIFDTAEAFAGHLQTELPRTLANLSACDGEAADMDAELDSCIDQYIAEFGAKAFRRPLGTDESNSLKASYDALRASQSGPDAFAALIQAILQSPQFLYVIESGEEAVNGTSNLVALSDYEMASRLSFLFLNSMPDSELFAAAEAGELSTPEQVQAQARRLAQSPRATEVLASFHRDWLQVYKLDNEQKNTGTFPEYDNAVHEALRHEVEYFTENVLADFGDFQGLMTSTRVPIHPSLEVLYGASSEGSGWSSVDLAGERKGLLTLASVNSAHAHSSSSSPILRGAFVRRQVLCGDTGTFPGDIDTVAPLAGTAELPTARERLAPLMENDQCQGCHVSMNPLGYAMENFDGIGRYRTEENGSLIDTSGRIEFAGDADGEFANTGEFIDQIAASETAQNCYATKWFSYSTSHEATDADRCDVDNIKRVFDESGGDLKELMIAVTETNAFRFLVRAE